MSLLPVKLSLSATLASLALSGCFLAGLPLPTLAGGNPGFTIFGGVERKDILDYYLDFGGHPNERDRYKLYIPAKKLPQGASKFFVSYPDYFDGKFDVKAIEVRVNGESQPVREAYWDREARIVEIDMLQPVAPNTKVELVFSNVRNPDFGTYYFVCDVLASGDIPVRLYVGTWILSINR